MKERLNSMKWKILLYFAVASMIIIAGGAILWIYIEPQLTPNEFWPTMAVFVALVCLGAGYLASRSIQRKVDMLHFAIMQITRGNLSSRIATQEGDAFGPIYRDFNEMAEYIEQRVQLLQKLGKENVMLQAQSNEVAVIEERKRLARDLHDTVSQQLFAIHMTASSLPQVKDEALAHQLEQQLIEMSHHAQKQMRGLIAQLRPIELEDQSLREALERWFPDYCRQNGLQGTLDIRVQDSIAEAIEHQLFLLIQEGMANTVKHASADQVMLVLYGREHSYVLQITDNGVGFDPQRTKTGSYGLTTMKERAQKLGGDLEIMSREGSGTRLDIRIPKFREKEEGDQDEQ